MINIIIYIINIIIMINIIYAWFCCVYRKQSNNSVTIVSVPVRLTVVVRLLLIPVNPKIPLTILKLNICRPKILKYQIKIILIK